jgi:hypothetical protein
VGLVALLDRETMKPGTKKGKNGGKKWDAALFALFCGEIAPVTLRCDGRIRGSRGPRPPRDTSAEVFWATHGSW